MKIVISLGYIFTVFFWVVEFSTFYIISSALTAVYHSILRHTFQGFPNSVKG